MIATDRLRTDIGLALASGAARASLDLRAFWFIACLAGVEVLWAGLAGLRIEQGTEALLLVAMPLGMALALDAWGVARRVAMALNMLALWLSWMILGCVLTYLVATFNFPLRDEAFSRLDAVLGFEWPKYVQLIESVPALDRLLMVAYLSMLPQVAFSIAFFAREDRVTYAREAWWATMAAIVVTCAISGLLPALCAWDQYRTAEHLNIHIPHLLAARDGTLAVLPIMSLKAIVTFPSFHAVMAVLLTYPYRRSRTLFPLIAGLNALMLLSIPKHGGHYLVDVLGGVSVAVFCIFLVRKVSSPAPAMTRAWHGGALAR